MKNLKLNLKGLYGYRQSLLSRSPQPRDEREMSERRPSEERTFLAPLLQCFARYAAILIMLLTLGVGQMWADWYISGWESLTGHNWGTYDDCKMVDNKVTFSNRPKADYQFKLTDGTNWYGHSKLGSAIGTASISSASGWDNAQITLSVASDVHFYRYGDNMVSVVGVPTTCYVTGNGNEKGANWCGGVDWDEDGSTMTKNSDGTHTLKFTQVPAGTGYKFKITNGTWNYTLGHSNYDSSNSNISDVSDGTDNNVVIDLEALADVTITLDGNKVIVNVEYYYTGLSVSATPSGIAPTGYPTISALNVLRGNSVTVDASTIPTGYNLTWSSSNGSFGNLSASSTTFTPTANNAVATVTYTEKTYNVTVASNNYTYGTIMSGQTTNQTVSAKHFTSDCSITAEALTGYRFTEWTYTGSVVIADASSISTTIIATATGATVTANFEPIPAGQLDIVAGANGQVKKESGSWGSSASYTDIADAGNYNIYAQANAGYHFVNWTKSGDGSITTNAASGVYAMTANGTATVTANFAEDLRTLTPTVSYDHGSSTYTATSANQLGVATTSVLTASNPNAVHYTFAGWTLTNLTVTSGTAATDLSITVKVTDPAQTCSAVANYNEVLTTTWKIIGQSPSDKANAPFSSWTYASSTNTMAKATGHSTESVVYATISVPAASVTGDYYEFKVTSDGSKLYGFGTSDGYYILFDVTKTDQSVYSNDNSDHALQFKPNVAGDYIFKVDYSGSNPSVSVTFPTSYTVNFGVSPTGAADAPTNDKSISNGGLVLSSTNVTFTAAAANTGYTWDHWEVGGENVGTSSTYTTSITAATTVTAVYTEDTHTVTVAKDATGGGNISTTSVSAGVATASATITATPANLAWRFKNWTVPNGVTIASGSTTSASITINATEDGKTITANFEPRYGLVGSRLDGTTADGMPLWTEAADFVVTSFTDKDNMSLTCTRTLSANKDYKFQVYDRESDSRRGGDNDAKMTLGESWKLTGSGLISFDTKGAGGYTFEITKIDDANYQPSIQINAPTSYTVTFDKGTGGSDVTASGSVSGSITSGQYVAEGEDITFTQTPETGYTFKGWYDAASGGSAISSMASDNVLDNIAANATVYAQYTENMTTVNLASTTGGHIEIGGEEVPSTTAGVYTTRSITAVPDEGWYFAGWTVSDGADCKVASTDGRNDNESQTTVLSGLGAGTTGVVTANFVENDKIYFRNIFDDGEGNVTRWESVYVHFDITWTEHDGKQAVQTSSDNISKGLHCSMTKIGTSDVYWAYVPRYITTNSKTRVAFADHDDSYNDSKLWEGNAAGRGDYNPLLNMFVPHHTKLYSTNSVDYYSNGYWMKYDTRASQGAGYYLKVYNNRNDYTQKGEFTADTDDATIIQYQVRIDNVSEGKTRFMITSAGGLNYIADETVTSASGAVGVSENLSTLTDNDVYFQLTATSEGYYTFIIDQTGDKMKLTVDYPVSPGDYRLKHTYSGRNKANMADSTYTTYSDVIKASTAGTAKTYSMYLNSASATLVLQECTSINETTTLPEWNDGIATNLDGLLTKVGIDGNGVYQFDITVNTTSHQVNTVTNIGKYTGNYYIKTDCATGGWVNYTSNAMEANTINATAAGYDYYYCKWVGNTSTNVKCVIANDYCNQLSDTLESDAILTRNGIAYQTLPYAANVRFSYNSSTNAINRTYLLGSSDANSFLRLKPAAAGYVFTSSDRSTDLYTTDTKFQDNGNWTYQMDVYVYQGAKGGVYTDYPTTSPITRQQLVDTINNELMGGTEGTTLYKVRMVYDYKTDYLMSAWMASGVQTQTIDLKSDFMYVRNAQKDADQLSFSNGATVSDAHKAYGAIELKFDSMVNQMSSWTAKAYRQCMYYISFPFDVNVSDIFGIGEMGTDWRIQKYNGAKRAQIGWFAETETFWEDLTEDSVMHAYEGYSLLLNRVKFNNSSSSVWTNISSGGSVFLYFPSATNVNALSHGTRSITVPEHKCTIDKTFGQDAGLANPRNHKYTDSNWNMVGAPLFQNLAATNIATGAVVGENNDSTFNYVYAWNSFDNTLGVRSTLSTSFVFNSMYAYMVQYAGDVTFTGAMLTPESVAARRKAENKDYTIELNLHKEQTFSGRAYVELRENADDDYLLNEDMYMMRGSKTADLYTYAGSYDVAANVLSVDNHVVPIGVNVLSAGTYIFSMPSNFSGTVTLIDRAADTRTNLLLGDYEVYLPKGEQNDRFLLEINIRTVPTAIDGTQGGSLKDGQDHKYIENGTLRILHNGMLYDAQGHRVQ